jgi:U4/U6.U5 tri-snRNP-associated protein 2
MCNLCVTIFYSIQVHRPQRWVFCFNVVTKLGLLIRKLWNPKAFKGHVSPHEFIQEVSRVSKKQFVIGSQADPIQFLTFLLNSLHLGLGGSRKSGSSK